MPTKTMQGSIKKLRFHIHEPVIFNFVPQTPFINKVVLKEQSSKLIPKKQCDALQQSFNTIMTKELHTVKNDNHVAALYRKIYRPFLKDHDLSRYFGKSAIIHQVRCRLAEELQLRKDTQSFLYNLYKDSNQSFGILRSDYLKTLGIMQGHYSSVLYNVFLRTRTNIKCKFSQPLAPNQSYYNEDAILEYQNLSQPMNSEVIDYMMINLPEQAESLTSVAFKLGMKVVVITEPNFERPTSMISKMLDQYDQAKLSNNSSMMDQIKIDLAQLDQITVKNLYEFQKFVKVVQQEHTSRSNHKVNDLEDSFSGKLEQMELGILGSLESKAYVPFRKAY